MPANRCRSRPTGHCCLQWVACRSLLGLRLSARCVHQSNVLLLHKYIMKKSKTMRTMAGTEATSDLQRCVATSCPGTQQTNPLANAAQLSPCRGTVQAARCVSPGQEGYVTGSGRYYCRCLFRGISHGEFSRGICCLDGGE